ncbi:hypothetical protein FOCC_FOCC013228 [Frankliniella occidentalis]|nr:hypothetical protein FOCC_FOCC013228 [Frankliniella occidentalis]
MDELLRRVVEDKENVYPQPVQQRDDDIPSRVPPSNPLPSPQFSFDTSSSDEDLIPSKLPSIPYQGSFDESNTDRQKGEESDREKDNEQAAQEGDSRHGDHSSPRLSSLHSPPPSPPPPGSSVESDEGEESEREEEDNEQTVQEGDARRDDHSPRRLPSFPSPPPSPPPPGSSDESNKDRETGEESESEEEEEDGERDEHEDDTRGDDHTSPRLSPVRSPSPPPSGSFNESGEGGREESEREEADDEQDDQEDEARPKKRVKRQPLRQNTSQIRLSRKIARNKGQEYTTATGKTVREKVAERLVDCRNNCAEKIPIEVAEDLCDSVWKNLGDATARRRYIAGQINRVPKKSQRINLAASSRKKREFSYEYFACLNGSNIKVCKGCFMKIYQISKKAIEIIHKLKIANTAGLPKKDERGSTSNGLEENRLQEVIDHINSFPKYQSHYCRQRTESKFLASNLTEKTMYEEYCKMVEKKEVDLQPVSRWVYSREVHKLGLKFKALHADTCHRCDTLEAAVKYSKTDEEREENKQQQTLHHLKAEAAIEQKKADKAKAKENVTVETITFDLQQCLPTPSLSTSIIFYLRQLWVYNLTIHIMSTGHSIHNMWHEAEGGRGANQVGSALFKYILSLPDEVEHLIMWSDTCGGQNKNSIINSALVTALSRKKTLKVIDQKFLVPGHTHLECDGDHAVIENKKRQAPEIHVPRDWYNLVRNASKKFSVQLLKEHQLDFKALHTGKTSPLVKRKVTTTKIKFVWKDVVWIRHRRNLDPGVVAFKKTLNEDDDFEYLNLRRRKKGEFVLAPKKAYSGPKPIGSKKKKDLLSMLHLLDPDCHSFYHSLPSDDAVPEDRDPDLLPSSDEEDSEEE